MVIKESDQKTTQPQQSNFIRNQIAPDQRHQYVKLSQRYHDQTVDLFTKAFCRAEPMTHYLAMDEKKYKIFANSVVKKAIEDELSVIALDNDKVVACALVEDIAAPGAIPDFDPKFNFILALLEKIGEKFFKNKQFKKGHIAHLFITAVDSEYRHLGLSKQINFHAMDIAALHDFAFIYCEFTHYFNEKGVIPHLKNSKVEIGSQIYRDFIFEEKKPFEKLAGSANAFLWEIKPNANLEFEENGQAIVTPF